MNTTEQQSLRELCEQVSITVKNGTTKAYPAWAKQAWMVTLTYQKRKLTVPFYGGGAADEPNAWSVLDCLLSDAQAEDYTFGEWIREYGGDTDIDEEMRLWRQCCAMAKRLRRFLGDDFDTFQYADRN